MDLDDNDHELGSAGENEGDWTDEGSFQREDDGGKPSSLELNLFKLLKDTSQYQGTFAFSSTYSAAPNPGLKIQGFSDSSLRLPVSPEDAAKLSDLGSTSPFGRGEKTLVDPKVRSTRQLDPSQLKFENSAFLDWLRGPVLKEMSTTLGIGVEMNPKLNLYKLLIYKKGDHFKSHRDSPKENGMIGTVVVILPSDFEGGVVRLSHDSEEKSLDFGPDCRYNFGVAAWYSDVEHAVDEISAGYRVALVYNLVVEKEDLSAETTAVSRPFLDILQKLKETTHPIAYSLINRYSLTQRRHGFKGKDRYIISNLIAGINKIGGIAVCCGDLELKRSEYEDEDEEDEDENVPTDFMRSRNGYADVTVKNIEHLAGAYRHFSVGQMEWRRPLYSLGPPLYEMEPVNHEEEDTGNEGMMYTSWYRTSCIILWPTSETTSIIEQNKEPHLAWKDMLKIVNKPPPASDTEEEKTKLEFVKICALINRCIIFPPFDEQIRQAGEMVYSRLKALPPSYTREIEDKVLKEAANQVSGIAIYDKICPNPSQQGISNLLKMKMLFPKNIQFSCDDTIKKLLQNRWVTLHPKLLRQVIETYQESTPEELAEYFRCAFKGTPCLNLLQDLYADFEKNTSEDSLIRKLLNRIPFDDFQEYIIAGIKDRIGGTFFWNRKLDEELKRFGRDTSIEEIDYPTGLSKGTEKSDAPGSPLSGSLVHYLEFLDEHETPRRTQLIELFVHAVLIPTDCFAPAVGAAERIPYLLGLESNAWIVRKFMDKPSLCELSSAKTLRDNTVDAAVAFFPPDAPDPPCYYLPAWNSPRCAAGAGCDVCGPVNQFLQSNTEHTFRVTVPETLKNHYTHINSELGRHGGMGANGYQYWDKLQVRFFGGYGVVPGTFSMEKVARAKYMKAKGISKTMIRDRKILFRIMKEPFNQFGKIEREVGDNFVPIVEKPDEVQLAISFRPDDDYQYEDEEEAEEDEDDDSLDDEDDEDEDMDNFDDGFGDEDEDEDGNGDEDEDEDEDDDD